MTDALLRTCRDCGKTKPLVDFRKRKSSPDGYENQCTVCNRRQSREWKRANPEKYAEQMRRWRERNPDKIVSKSARYYRENRERLHAYAKEWGKANPERRHDIMLKHAYGIPHGTYARLLAEQSGQCAICGTTDPGSGRVTGERPVKRFHVDHDHETGRLRALLCENCNKALGLFQDKSDLLTLAAAYLKRFGK